MTISTTLAHSQQRLRGFYSVELLVIGFVALYPLLANPFASPVFGLPKLTFLRLTVLAIASIWTVGTLRRGYIELPRSSLRLPISAFIITTIIAGLQSVHPLTSLSGQYGRWEGVSTTVSYIVLFAAAYGIVRNEHARKPLFIATIGSATIVSLIAIVEHFWVNPYLLFANIYCAAGFGGPNLFETERSMASFGNATLLAAYLAFMVPLILSALFAGNNRVIPRPLSYAALFFVTTALLLTFGRGAWLGAFAGTLLTAALQWKSLLMTRRKLIAVLLLVIAAIIVVQFGTGAYSISGRLASMFTIEGSTLTRVQMWEASLPLIAERPIFGSGPDTFKYVFGTYKPGGWVEHISDPLVDKAHNEFLQMAVTLGLAGLSAYLWVLITFTWSSFKWLRATYKYESAWVLAGIAGATLAFVLQLQFNFSHFTVSPFFWLFMGLACGLLEAKNPRTIFELPIFTPLRAVAYSLIAITATGLMVLSIAPLIADIQFAKGRELQAQQRAREALARYESAVAINGFETIYRTSLAETLIETGVQNNSEDHIKRGMSEFDRAQRLNPLDEQSYFKAGASMLKAGRAGRHPLLYRSIEQHTRGLALNPVMVDAYIDIGVAHAYANRLDEAIGAWNNALRIQPDNDRAYYNLGWAYEKLGDTARARDAYLKAYRLNPEMIDAKDAYDRL